MEQLRDSVRPFVGSGSKKVTEGGMVACTNIALKIRY
jgi:hypothetical protein